jgi:predicted small secreted protein
MSWTRRLLACAFIALTAIVTSGCTEVGGVGMGVPVGGTRWGSGAAGPGVIVGGGPVYR